MKHMQAVENKYLRELNASKSKVKLCMCMHVGQKSGSELYAAKQTVRTTCVYNVYACACHALWSQLVQQRSIFSRLFSTSHLSFNTTLPMRREMLCVSVCVTKKMV